MGKLVPIEWQDCAKRLATEAEQDKELWRHGFFYHPAPAFFGLFFVPLLL